ncbi:MAG TPA: helicase-associated domain-containing protein [Thermomicrobiales bacterium]
MRNLLGRLNARTTEELTRIAATWQVPLSAGDRPGMVSRLYRALADPRTVRDCWDRLPDDERAMVRLLAVSEETALTLPELAAHLGVAEEDARQIAVRLYHEAIVAREGDDEPLPVGALPRLFLPRELTLLFRRVQDEIEAGDISETPLRALLALLDDRELEEAAEIWGVRVIAGLRGREDLTRQILQQVGDAERVAAVAGKRRRDAALIWRRLRDATNGAPVALAEAADAAGLALGEARRAQRLRDALAELEGALLVWHTYRPDGSRWLFVPAEIRAPGPTRRDDLPALTPVFVPPVEAVAWRSPSALAWDLLTLLRELSVAGAPRVHVAADLPRSWRRHVNRGLWNRGAEVPPIGYLEFLAALAQAEGLLLGGAESGQEPLAVGPAIRLWRNRSFADQMERLRWWWLASQSWIEGSARKDVEVWGAEWVPFRRKLLVHLSALTDGGWYALDDLAGWLAARDPEMLGATFTVATARHVEATDPGEGGRRRAAIAEVAAVTVETAFRWFGLIEVAEGGRRERMVRLTYAGQAMAGAQPVPAAEEPGDGPPLTVGASGEIVLRDPSPLRVWSLSAFAEVERLDRLSTYRLTEEAVGRALTAGFETRQIVSFLAMQVGVPVSPDLERRLQEWSRGFRRVRLRRAVVVSPDDPAHLDALHEAAERHGFTVRPFGESLVVLLSPAAGDEEAMLAAVWRDDGFTPQWDARAPVSRQRDEVEEQSGTEGPPDRRRSGGT